jgi:hypothetical protein
MSMQNNVQCKNQDLCFYDRSAHDTVSKLHIYGFRHIHAHKYVVTLAWNTIFIY